MVHVDPLISRQFHRDLVRGNKLRHEHDYQRSKKTLVVLAASECKNSVRSFLGRLYRRIPNRLGRVTVVDFGGKRKIGKDECHD